MQQNSMPKPPESNLPAIEQGLGRLEDSNKGGDANFFIALTLVEICKALNELVNCLQNRP